MVHLKVLCKIRKTRLESRDMLQAYGDGLVSMPTFYLWYEAFWDGRENVVNEQWERWPSKAHNEVLQNTAAIIIREDRRITVYELAQHLNITVGKAFTILHND